MEHDGKPQVGRWVKQVVTADPEIGQPLAVYFVVDLCETDAVSAWGKYGGNAPTFCP